MRVWVSGSGAGGAAASGGSAGTDGGVMATRVLASESSIGAFESERERLVTTVSGSSKSVEGGRAWRIPEVLERGIGRSTIASVLDFVSVFGAGGRAVIFCEESIGSRAGGGGKTRAVGSVGGTDVGCNCVGASSACERRETGGAPDGGVGCTEAVGGGE